MPSVLLGSSVLLGWLDAKLLDFAGDLGFFAAPGNSASCVILPFFVCLSP